MNNLAKRKWFWLYLSILLGLCISYAAAEEPAFAGDFSFWPDLSASEKLEAAYTASAYSRKSNITFNDPQRSINSQILLAGVSFDHYDLIDNRQQVVHYYAEAEEQEQVVLDIAIDTTNYTGKLGLPLAEPEQKKLRRFLGADQLIDPNSAEIQALIASITAASADAWITAAEIMKLVSSYQGDMIHRALLFAALTRAAGIPTRFAVGIRYFDTPSRWIGWIWNEIWLGRWVAVDPACQQMAPDALLIKLLSAPSLADLKLKHSDFGILQLAIRQIDITAEP